MRPLAIAVADGHAIQKRFKVREPPSSELIDFLTNDVDYVNPAMKIVPDKPARFYRGFDVNWYAIEKNLDVRRSLTETMLWDIVIRPEEDRPTSTELFVARDGQGDWIFFHTADHDEAVWQRLKIHGRVSFEVGFSFAGVRAVDLKF